MKKVIVILSLLVGFAYADKSKAVIVSVDDEHGHICHGIKKIRGIDKHGDGFVSIRKGPGSKYSIKRKAYRNGEKVAICASSGNWIGIIYSTKSTQGVLDCGLSLEKRTKSGSYKETRSCQTGWIYKSYLTEHGIAG